MKRGKDDLKMGPPSMAGDLIAERDKLRKQLAAAVRKNQILEEELNEAVKLLKLEDIDAAIAKIKK